jgi:flagellar hook-associated protein 2
VELIKGFVTKYNEVLDKINAKLSEKRDYDFEPLTDSQKAAMTEEEIKQWEEKAKAGILANDGLLRDIVSGLRNAVMQAVDGNGLLLSSIGIKSASWLDKGKLYIDEDKLTKALTENPDQVFDLFTKQSNVLYSTAATDSSARSERFNESGLIQRISDVIQDNIRTNTYRERRGALLEKAGITGDRSQFNNLLYNQISDYDRRIDRLNDALFAKENSYYLQFAQLEALINNMNTQSAWLAQQFAY